MANNAYQAAASIIGAELEKTDQKAAQAIKQVTKNDIIVVRGAHDQIEDVFMQGGIPFTLIEPAQVATYGISPEQIMFVNCIGEFPRASNAAIERYVADGGYLTTTDWCLNSVVEQAFPGYIAFNGKRTRNDVVAVEIKGNHPILSGLQARNPKWWLEGSSYPVRIDRPSDVEILIDSEEMRQKYNDGPIVVTFNYGKGQVVHMVSHYKLQQYRNESGKSAVDFAKDLLGASELANLKGLEGVTADEVEAAYASSRLVQNMILDKKRRGGELEDN